MHDIDLMTERITIIMSSFVYLHRITMHLIN